jgi:hypothetical protein
MYWLLDVAHVRKRLKQARALFRTKLASAMPGSNP